MTLLDSDVVKQAILDVKTNYEIQKSSDPYSDSGIDLSLKISAVNDVLKALETLLNS